MTALLIGLFAGPAVIRQPDRAQDRPADPRQRHGNAPCQSGTPTMGGVLILLAIAISTLLWADLSNRFVWIVLLVTLGFGAIGWADDWRKVVTKTRGHALAREIPLAVRSSGWRRRCTWCSAFPKAPTSVLELFFPGCVSGLT